jgi:putative spermidine/putrescine transport system permease protein
VSGRAAPRTIVTVLVLLFVSGPTVLVVALSFGSSELIQFPPDAFTTRWYAALVSDPAWSEAAVRSMLVGCVSAGLAAVVGTAAAVAVVRGAFPGRRLVELGSLVPMIVPPVVLAVGGYQWFLDLQLVGSLWGLALLHAVVAIPFVVLVVSASLYRADPALELASASLGAGPVRTFVRVTLPLLLPAIAVGAFFAFLSSLDEVVIALFLVGPTEPTLPLQVYGELATGLTPTVAAVTSAQLLLVVFLVVVWFVVRRGRRRERRTRS